MSNGLMSCVRESSPALETDEGGAEGPFSLPLTTSPVVEHQNQKRRSRFHPLRNLRRIFRRRTLTNADAVTSPSSPSSSLSQMSSSPTVIAAGPAHTSYFKNSNHSPSPVDVTNMSSTSSYPSHHMTTSGGLGGNRNIPTYGLPAIPPFSTSVSASGGFYHKESGKPFSSLHVDGDSGGGNHNRHQYQKHQRKEEPSTTDLDENREMMDYQRSLSEGRLVDGDFNREGLSQSHDSVFSESATASSLSIVLKAELFDVLRKRRNRPDASDEDLGLPRSPNTPQRIEHNIINQNHNQSEGSLSLLSMASSDLDEESSNFGGVSTDKANSSSSSRFSQQQTDTSRSSTDEIDLDLSAGSRLSHSAARHKMAVRPIKKKGPTRHRRPIETTTVLPSTPEVNEDVFKVSSSDNKKAIIEKTKSQSLPPGVNSKMLEQHSGVSLTKSTKETTSTTSTTSSATNFANIKKSKTESSSISASIYSNRNISKSFDFEDGECSSPASTLERKDDDGGFFRRLLHRNSKKNKKHAENSQIISEETHTDRNSSTVERQTTSNNLLRIENNFRSDLSHKIEETRIEIRKEIMSEAKSGLSAMLNNFILSPNYERDMLFSPAAVLAVKPTPNNNKPKSGPASRQRVFPKDLTATPLPKIQTQDEEMSVSQQLIEHERGGVFKQKPAGSGDILKFNKALNDDFDDIFKEPSQFLHDRRPKDKLSIESHKIPKVSSEEILIPKLVRLSSSAEEQSHSMSPPKGIWNNEHYEKCDRNPPKILGLSPFQLKLSRTDVNTNTASDTTRPSIKPRKSVEKSKSFRYFSENTDSPDEKNLKKYENMPSLPDLTMPRIKLMASDENINLLLPEQPKSLSMGFEINDNNLIKLRNHEEPLPLSQGIYTKNIILTSSRGTPACNQNITEIEENIDKLVKSPFVSILRKSPGLFDSVDTNTKPLNVSITDINKIGNGKENSFRSNEGSQNELFKSISKETPKSVSIEKLNKVERRNRAFEKDANEKLSIEKRFSHDFSFSSDSRGGSKEKLNTPTKARRSSSIYERSSEDINKIPEFMKIQLNRVDSGRPKSHIVLSKNAKELDGLIEVTRRFSNENVEITSEQNKPPLPPEPILPPTKRNNVINVNKIHDEISKNPHKSDKENNILKNAENTPTTSVAERRKSLVSDGKMKYEKKIEELKLERKKSASEDIKIETRKSSIVDEESVVVLRKKSFGSLNKTSTATTTTPSTTIPTITTPVTTGKEDTPELMKVFARRSLKIKDPEDINNSFDETSEPKIPSTNSLKRAGNIDSDKENQSSSEEKLDKLPKVEITIQQKPTNGSFGTKIDEKNQRTSIAEVYRKPVSSSSIFATSAKPFVPTTTRFANVTNFRNSSATSTTNSTLTTSVKKTAMSANGGIATSLTSTSSYESATSTNSSECNNNNTNNNNNNNGNVTTTLNNNKISLRHTIGGTSPAIKIEPAEDSSEFKGILQRRAEWEKRAKEASK